MIANFKWRYYFPQEAEKKEVKFIIIPDDVKEKMSQVTTRDLYIWGRKHGIIKRLPRKTKKRLYYGKSKKYETKATIACVKIWNEYYEQTYEK